MRSNLALWQTVAVVASCVGLSSACGLGSGPPYVPPPAIPSVKISPPRLDFTATPGTESEVRTVTLTNVSSAPVKVHEWKRESDRSPSFFIKSGCEGALAPGSNCEVQLTFRPAQDGQLSGVLDFEIDGQLQNVRLFGDASAPETVPPSKQ